MGKLSLCSFFCLLLVISCKKKDSDSGTVTTEKITYTTDSSNVKPGVFVTLSANHSVPKDSISISLANTSTVLYKMDSLHYGFVVPVIASGTYNLDLSKVNAANTPSLKIADYTAIPDPDVVIDQTKIAFNNIIDSLKQNSFSNSLSVSDIGFLQELMAQINKNIKSLNGQQKLIAAYQMQQLNLSTSVFHSFQVDTSHLAKLGGSQDDISVELSLNAMLAGAANYGAKAAGITSIALFTAWAITGFTAVNLIAGSLVAFAAYCYLKAKAISLSTQVSDITGIATGNLMIADGTGTSANPIQLSASSGVFQKIKSIFRTIQSSDNSMNNDISDFIVSNNELESTDSKMKQLYDKARTYAGNLFDQLKQPYTVYVSPVLSKAKEKIASVQNPFISVANASDKDIQVTLTDAGANGIQINATNPSKNINTETSFSFQLVYTQSAINNKTFVTEQAKFKPPVKLTLSNPSRYPVTEPYGGLSNATCAGYAIADFICSANDWDATSNAPKFTDAGGTTRIVNGVLLQNITNIWGFNFTSCTSSGPTAVIFYNTSIANGVVTGKVKVIGDFGTCSPPYGDQYFTSFNFTLINSALAGVMQTTYAGTYVIASNTLYTSQ